MTIQSVSSSAATSATNLQATAQQRRLDMQNLASALQSGDLTSAQQAFAQLQKDNPRLAQALASAPSSSDNPRLADFKSLASALQSGDVSGAQQAFAKLQADTPGVARGGHHHHHHAAAAPAASSGSDADGDNDGTKPAGSLINTSA